MDHFHSSHVYSVNRRGRAHGPGGLQHITLVLRTVCSAWCHDICWLVRGGLSHFKTVHFHYLRPIGNCCPLQWVLGVMGIYLELSSEAGENM